MKILAAIPILMAAVILQSSMVSRLRLLSGHADLVLVLLAAWTLQERVDSSWHWAFLASIMTAFVTRLPWPAVMAGYFAIVLSAQLLSRRIWHAPLLAMFGVTFLGTLLMHFITYVVLVLLGTPLPLGDVLAVITLPSLMLNMLLAIPIFAVMRDVARWTFPAPETA